MFRRTPLRGGDKNNGVLHYYLVAEKLGVLGLFLPRGVGLYARHASQFLNGKIEFFARHDEFCTKELSQSSPNDHS